MQIRRQFAFVLRTPPFNLVSPNVFNLLFRYSQAVSPTSFEQHFASVGSAHRKICRDELPIPKLLTNCSNSGGVSGTAQILVKNRMYANHGMILRCGVVCKQCNPCFKVNLESEAEL